MTLFSVEDKYADKRFQEMPTGGWYTIEVDASINEDRNEVVQLALQATTPPNASEYVVAVKSISVGAVGLQADFYTRYEATQVEEGESRQAQRRLLASKSSFMFPISAILGISLSMTMLVSIMLGFQHKQKHGFKTD